MPLTLQRGWLSQLPTIAAVWNRPSNLPATRIAWSLAVLFAIAYAAMFTWLSPLALQDLPNQLARTRIMDDLLFQHGARFGARFDLHFLLVPYLLGDVVLATVTRLFGTTAAAMFWVVVSFLSLPLALNFYLRTTRLPSDAKALLVLVSLYLSTDWFFLVGFLEFRIGVAVTLVILALAERFRLQPRAPRLLLYAVVLLAGYLIHLTTLVFASALLGSISLWRLLCKQTRLPVEAALLAPCAALFIWHFGFTNVYRQTDDLVENRYIWGTVPLKLTGMMGEFRRYNPRPDQLLLGTLIAAIACRIGYFWRRHSQPPAVALESLVLAAIMLAVYFVLPMGYAEAYYVDVRALPFVCIFLILGLLHFAPADARGSAAKPALAILLAAALIGGNLAYLTAHMRDLRQRLTQYRSVIAVAPPHARILPIYTRGADGKVVPLLHAFAFASIDREAVVPYLQTADTGNPQKYLRYRHRPYAPEQLWYSNLPPDPVDWHQVACDYQYLLVTKPFDPSRFNLTTTLRVENNTASLLAIRTPTTCLRAAEAATAQANSP